MGKSIKKNYIYNLANQILSLITPVVTAPYLARALGASAIGYHSFVSSIAIYFSVFAALGTFTVGQREIAYCQNDIIKRTKVFYDLASLRALLSLFVTIIYVTVIVINRMPLIYYTQILLLLNISLDFSWVFIGLEEFSIIVCRQIVAKFVTIIFIFLFIKKPDDIIIYSCMPLVICLVCYISYLPDIIKRIDTKTNYKCNVFKFLNDSIMLFIPYIATTINTHFDKIMIGINDETKLQNGYYEEAIKIISILLMVITVLGNTMMPRIGALYKENKTDLIKIYMLKSYKYTFMIALPMFFGLLCSTKSFVPWFFGKEFLPTIPIVMIMSILMILTGISYLTGFQYLIGTGKQNVYTVIVTIGTIINIIINVFLIPYYKAIGAAIATVISEFFIAVIELVYINKHISVFSIFSGIKNYVLAALIMFIIESLLFANLFPTPVNSLIIVLSGATIYITLLLVLKDDLFYSIAEVIFNRFYKIFKHR